MLVSALWLRGRVAARIAAVLAFVMIGFLLTALLVPGAIGLVTRFYNPEEVYGLDRIYFYVTGLQLFMTHPFLGVGAGNYQFFDRIYAEVSAGGIAHNQFITVAAETGMPGLIALLWLLVAVLKIPRKFNLWEGRQGDPHYWVKAAGSCARFDCGMFVSRGFCGERRSRWGNESHNERYFCLDLAGDLILSVQLESNCRWDKNLEWLVTGGFFGIEDTLRCPKCPILYPATSFQLHSQAFPKSRGLGSVRRDERVRLSLRFRVAAALSKLGSN